MLCLFDIVFDTQIANETAVSMSAEGISRKINNRHQKCNHDLNEVKRILKQNLD